VLLPDKSRENIFPREGTGQSSIHHQRQLILRNLSCKF
jgi:hypothetical protein